MKEFVIIAGPCVLEGDGTLNLRTAEALQRIIEPLQSQHNLKFYFKSSFDKANRTSIDSYRGPGMEEGLTMLRHIKQTVGVPILTDIHQPADVVPSAEVADMLQIPAFLCRQTDLVVEAGRSGKPVNIKKGQFLSPYEVKPLAQKVQQTGNSQVYITERGTTFGYNNLVVDMRSIPIVHDQGLPLIFDATHSVQQPGGLGNSSGGKREFVPTLARAAVAAGCDGLFIETHPDPDRGPSDGPNMIPLAWVEPLLKSCLAIRETVLAEQAYTYEPGFASV